MAEIGESPGAAAGGGSVRFAVKGHGGAGILHQGVTGRAQDAAGAVKIPRRPADIHKLPQPHHPEPLPRQTGGKHRENDAPQHHRGQRDDDIGGAGEVGIAAGVGVDHLIAVAHGGAAGFHHDAVGQLVQGNVGEL